MQRGVVETQGDPVTDTHRDDAFREEVVIVGMAGRFPGAASVDELWANLRNGVESIRPLSPDDLVAAGVDAAAAVADGYVAAGAPLDHADAFDAAFFGYSRREAELMDPQHRVFLECAWSALEDAGYDPVTFPGLIGLFGGVAPNTYRHQILQTRPDILGMTGRYPLLIGSEREYAITRTAFKLDLEGPVINVNTACSTSGVALHLACQSVLSGECDMALAGGARVSVPLTAGYVYEEDGILSPDGHCRAFDAEAKGTVVGSGVAVVVLKRLSDALRDRDTTRAVVKGTAVNNDGSDKIGFTAPSVRGQEAVIRQALDMADVDASTIGYVEAHGTGTLIGDPIEIEALTRAYRRDTSEVGYCRIGSIKTNIGHLDAGAGAAGVIKAILALEHAEIPASLNITTPNPQIDFHSSPFRVSDRLSEWPVELAPRRAAVSSFGLGGTNAHVVLEQAPAPAPPSPSIREHHLFVLSARTDEAVAHATRNLATHLERHPELEPADVAYTLAVGRRHHGRRRAVVARDAGDAARALTASSSRPVHDVAGDRPVVFMFPGGGVQHVGMARRLHATEPEFQRWFDRCAELMASRSGSDLCSLVYGEHTTDLVRPVDALPTLFATEYATARLLESLGVRPDLMIGHSLGEYTAACLADVMSLEDAVALVALRGELFETLPPGAMLAVQLSVSALEQQLGDDLSIAAINRPELCIVAGAEHAVDELERRLAQEGIEARRLHIGVAAHSHLVEPILDRFGEFASTIDFSEPSVPYISNLTGKVIDSDEICKPEYWVAHLRNTVRFDEGLAAALAGESKVVVEVGPGQILSGFARQHVGRVDGQVVVATLPHPSETTPDDAFFLDAVGKLWAAGVPVDLAALHAGEERRRVPLPTYPFDRTRYWIEPGTAPTSSVPQPDLAAPEPPRTGSGATRSTDGEPASRRDRIRARVLGVFSELSGLAEAEIDPFATFLELGFDSLFMTQATAAVGSTFGTRISFRQLFEEAPTIDALAGWLDSRLPGDAFPAAPVASAPVADAGLPAQPTGLDEIAAQLAQLQQQVAALSRGEPKLVRDTSVATASVEPSAPPEPSGPWRPPERRADELDRDQRRHLAELTERLTSRSPGSKRATQANRSRLADPRTVAGFRRAWKEIVYPVVAERSAGSKLWDVDGNEYLDVAMGFGVNLFGHSPQFVIDAVNAQLSRGIEIGPQTPLAGEVAELISEMTGHERVAFCNTGSEAVLAAMRLARTVTGRTKIVTFANDYHGVFDEVLARGVSQGGTRRSVPIAQGIPEHAPQDLVIFEYADPEALRYVADHASELAAVLVEPVQSRHPDLQPVEFLRELRRVTSESRVALIFDEMITGFRSHPGGVQARFGVKADLATYGKVIGGGFPIGIVAGDARFMDALDGGAWQYGDDSIPEADVTWFAGTFVRHPVALAASRAALLHLREAGPKLQEELNERTTGFVVRLNHFLREMEVPLRIEHFSSLFLVRFERDQQFSSLFYFHLRDQGIHITENRAAFLSTAHSDADLEHLDTACRAAVTAMVESRFLSSGFRSLRAPAAGLRELPVTDGQQEILLSAFQSADANCAYNLSNTLHVTGPLDVSVLRRSIDELAVRHDALRVTFTADGTRQRIAPELQPGMSVLDLSGLDEEARVAALAEQRAVEVDTPFDLVDGPLVRARLIRMTEDDHHLFLTVHHAVCDGWSSSTLLRHLVEIYTARRQDRAVELPAAMQLSDYAEWFDQYRTSEEYAADERFWVRQVATDFPVTDLPGDHVRPPRKSYRAERIDRPLPPELVADLRAVAKAEGCTLFTLLLGSFECLLGRLTGQREVGLAVSIAGQTRFPGRDLVAHCVNALPLRRAVEFDASFSHHVAETQAAFLDAFDHQDFSYGAIVRSSGVRRDPSRTPLVSIIFNMDSPAQSFDMDGAVAIPGSNERHSETFDAFINVVPRIDELVVECTYNTDLFDAGTIDRRLDEWLTMLSRVAASSGGVVVGELDVVPAAELALLDEWNSTAVDFNDDDTLVSLFEAAAARHNDAVAVEFAGRVVSYAELARMATRVARHLVELGVGRGSILGVLCERSVESVAGLYGVLMAGAAYVPLDPEHPVERISHMVGDTGMKVVLGQGRFQELVADPGVVLVDVDELLAARDEDDNAEVALPGVEPDDVAYVIYTSGSTGRPKGVANTHRGIVNRCLAVQDRFGLGPGAVVLQKTPFGFDVSVSELFWPLQTGARLVVAEPDGHRDLAYLVETIVCHGVDTLDFVPSMLRLFLDYPPAASCTSLRRVTCGGEALTRDLQDRFFAVLPHAELHNMYGPTEAAIDVTAWQCRPDDSLSAVPIGAPMANTTIHILDDRMRRVPIGIPGELYIGGPQVAVGYVNREDLTAERFIPDPFDSRGRLYRTGDLARWLPNGHVDFLGRLDNQIKLRGQRIELGEIEATLGEHPTILDAAVDLRGDATGDPRLVAYLVPHSGGSVDVTEVRDYLKQRLPAQMIPAGYTVLDEPPLTTNGKLDRNALPAPGPIDATTTDDYVIPRTGIERDIAQMWSEVLGIDDVGAETDFFDLGGHSLKLMQLASRIDQAFGVRPALSSLFESTTVAGQAVLVTEALIAADVGNDEILAEVLADFGAGENETVT